jgi:hypothetical protein
VIESLITPANVSEPVKWYGGAAIAAALSVATTPSEVASDAFKIVLVVFLMIFPLTRKLWTVL